MPRRGFFIYANDIVMALAAKLTVSFVVTLTVGFSDPQPRYMLAPVEPEVWGNRT